MASSSDYILRGPPLEPIPDCSLTEHIFRKLKSHPKDTILQVNGETGAEQTCWEFLTASIKVSEGLNKIGLRKDDVVANLLINSLESAEVIMGTWLSGGTIAPLDHNLKLYELKSIFEMIKPKFIFCNDDEQLLNNVTSALELCTLSATVIVTNRTKTSMDSHLNFEDLVNVEADVANYKPCEIKSPSDSLAAILLSSGSTGCPKGVGITHRNLVFQDYNLLGINVFTNLKSVLQVSPFFWVTGVVIFLMSLTRGWKRIFTTNASPENVLKVIDKHKPEWTLISPKLLVSITIHPEFDDFDVSSLKAVIIGGSPFTPAMADKIKGRWRHGTVIQGYGTTEANGFITINEKNENIFSVGKVTGNVQVKIADVKTREPQKANVIGEICFKTPGIMKGYVGNERETKTCMDSQGWYCSGDLGYYDESGQLFVIDRIKEMIKVGNMQVSPSEVEDVILSLPGIVEAVVVGVTFDKDDYYLMAFIVKEEDSTLTEEDIQYHVENTLSEYKKLTGGVHFVNVLPKSGNGKVQRQKLKDIAKQKLVSKS